jgi:hypothetical protein
MKIKIEQITILIVLILIVIAALIMIGYRRVLKIEERVEGLEKVLLAVKKGVDVECSHQDIIEQQHNLLNTQTMNNPANLNNFFQKNIVESNQLNENYINNDDNISIHSFSDKSDIDDDNSENDNIEYQQNEINEDDDEDEDELSEISDEEEDKNEENINISNEESENEINTNHDKEVAIESDGINILMNEEKVNPVRNNKDININTITVDELNNNFKRPELFNLCAIHKIKVNKREDKKGDLINRIMDFQKKNVSI